MNRIDPRPVGTMRHQRAGEPLVEGVDDRCQVMIEIGAVASSSQVTVTVDDQGPGLPKGREEAIFEKFERGRKESATPGEGILAR